MSRIDTDFSLKGATTVCQDKKLWKYTGTSNENNDGKILK